MITKQREYLSPKQVWLPLVTKRYNIAIKQVKINDRVQIGDVLSRQYAGKQMRPVVSTVSGKIVDFQMKIDRYNQLTENVIIETDNTGNSVALSPLQGNISTSIIRQRLIDCGINQLDADGMYTEISFDRPISYLIVNPIFIHEPFMSIDYEYIRDHANDISDGIKLLKQACRAKKVILVIDKYMDKETIDALGVVTINQGIELKTINKKHVRGWEYEIAKKLVKRPLHKDLLEDGIMYVSSETCKTIHDAVRKGLVLTHRFIAVTGDAFPINAIYKVRIGTPFKDIVDDIGGYLETKAYNIHLGNFLTGTQVNNDEFSITQNITSIHVSTPLELTEEVCIKCGECNDICPSGILPQNIMDAEIRNNNYRIIQMHVNECVECGLCSYVCPSKINVMEWVQRAKRRIR